MGEFIIKVSNIEGDNCLTTLGEVEVSKTGTLNKEELVAYLKSLNGGLAPTAKEVEWVWTEADVLGDGQIHLPELVKATSLWYLCIERRGECWQWPSLSSLMSRLL